MQLKIKYGTEGSQTNYHSCIRVLMLTEHCFGKLFPHREGQSEKKSHTGLPANIVDMLVSIVMSDMNSINVSEKQEEWELIAKDNNFEAVMTKALTQTLVVGDGAF